MSSIFDNNGEYDDEQLPDNDFNVVTRRLRLEADKAREEQHRRENMSKQ